MDAHPKFLAVLNPRRYDGNFKYGIYCDKCGQKSSCLLGIQTKKDLLLLCKGCLTKGIELIDKEIIRQCD